MYFKVNEEFAMGAEVYRTRYSWGHKAHLYRVRTPEQSDEYIEGVKVTYYNRTWERYEFESALFQLVDKAFKKKLITKEEHQTLYDYIKNYEEPSRFNHIAAVAKLGEVFGSNQKESNDWKARMLKAGLPEGALQMPEDWDTLSEDEKQRRLDGAIEALK